MREGFWFGLHPYLSANSFIVNDYRGVGLLGAKVIIFIHIMMIFPTNLRAKNEEPSLIGGNHAHIVLEAVLGEGSCLELRAISIDGGDAGAQNISNLLVVGDIQTDEGQHA